MNEQAPVQKPKRARSPNYPGVDLETAISRARTLWQREQRNSAAVETILSHWGYKSNSGGGLTTISALKKFGLIVDEGSCTNRRARLSDLALTILLHEREESPERQDAIRRAALLPSIHAELWQQYSAGLPSDANLRFTLQRDKHFTSSGVDDFLEQFKRTLRFAGLTPGTATVSENGEESQTIDNGQSGLTVTPETPHAPPLPQSGQTAKPRAVQLPLSHGEWAILQAAFPVNEEAWNQMLAVLQAMKPGLVKEAPDE